MIDSPDKYISIDEEGYPQFGDIRVTDEAIGKLILENISFVEKGPFLTQVNGVKTFVEAFDEPYIAKHIEKNEKTWYLQLPYNLKLKFKLESLTLDEWDRFHGFAENGVPFVMSRNAQSGFFNLLDNYTDNSITSDGIEIDIPDWLTTTQAVETEAYWSNIYKTEDPGWELNKPAEALVDMLPRLKLPPSRVIVLGCGSGNDAAYFAQHGHFVTAVDISKEAIKRGIEKYGHLGNLTFVESNIFDLPHEMYGQFDIVFEHTCYCAINPKNRNELVSLWRKLLNPQGHLFAILFAMEKRGHPPFGGSEWELRERLKNAFIFVFWGRWRKSIERRKGREVFIYAQKK